MYKKSYSYCRSAEPKETFCFIILKGKYMYNKILAYSLFAVSTLSFACAEEIIPQEPTLSTEATQNQQAVLRILMFAGNQQEAPALCTDCKKTMCPEECKVVSYGKEHTDMQQIFHALQNSMNTQVIASPNLILTHNQESVLTFVDDQNTTLTIKCIPTFNMDNTITLALEMHFNDSVLKAHAIVENQEVVSAIHEHESNILCILMQAQTV